ncbi:MAG: hypothetical protein KAI74_01000 [Kiritimatiellae bacterium]|nr:hypothetical protein [Kiritimatiellia bacterium]
MLLGGALRYEKEFATNARMNTNLCAMLLYPSFAQGYGGHAVMAFICLFRFAQQPNARHAGILKTTMLRQAKPNDIS